MGFAEITEPLALVHPRAASVTVLSSSPELTVTELTTGTLHLSLDTDRELSLRPFATLALKVDGSFVTVTVPRVLGAECLRELLAEALPDGLLVITHPASAALVVTIARAAEIEPLPHLFATSLDARLRVLQQGPNRLLVRGVARGGAELCVRVGDRPVRLRLVRGETPLQVAERLRDALADTHVALLAVPAEPGGDALVTVLPRR